MLANHEHRIYAGNSLVWVGKYRNLKNISHWHFDHEIVACESGKASILLDQISYELFPGQCIFLHGQRIHSISSDEKTVLYVALFSEKLLPRITDDYCLEYPLFDDEFEVKNRLRTIRSLDFERGLFYDERVNTIMKEIVLDIFTHQTIRKESFSSSEVIEQYKNLLYDIDEHIKNYSFRRGAEYMHMSDAYFSRFFKKLSGMTFSQYLNHIRVNTAIDLLNEKEMSMTDISILCGFDTIRNFNRVFKEITGYAPRNLPKNYILLLRSNSNNSPVFDPTLSLSELVSE